MTNVTDISMYVGSNFVVHLKEAHRTVTAPSVVGFFHNYDGQTVALHSYFRKM
jgi:hypothetical protein